MVSLLRSCPSLKQEGRNVNCVVLQDHYVVSQALLAKCLKLYEESIKEKLEKGLVEKLNPTEQSKPSQKAEEEEDEVKGRRGKGGRRAARGKGKEEVSGKGKNQGKESNDSLIKEVSSLSNCIKNNSEH